MYFRVFLTVFFWVSSSSVFACDPNNVLCSKFINPVLLRIVDLNDFFFWLIIGLMGLSILFLAYTLFMDTVYLVNSVSEIVREKYRSFKVGEYVRLPDGSFVLAGSKEHQWLEYDGQTVHFSNTEFDKVHRASLDWNDSALDYLGKEQPEIIGYNDKYHDDVWNRQAPIGNPETYVSPNESEIEDEPFVRHTLGIEGFIDSLFSGGVDRETGEVIDDEPFDDWRN